MAHSVTITTPRLTSDELGEQYGLSKAEQESLIRLVRENLSAQRAGSVPRRKAVRKINQALSIPASKRMSARRGK